MTSYVLTYTVDDQQHTAIAQAVSIHQALQKFLKWWMEDGTPEPNDLKISRPIIVP